MQNIEFFYDFASPYSYLASTQIRAIAERTGARFTPRPFVLGAVFKAVGNEPPAKVAAKAPYMIADLGAWARDYGVPFRLPDAWPTSTIQAMRAVLAVADADASWRLAQLLFAAYWGHNRDISQPEVLAAVLGEAGLNAESVLAATSRPEIKDRLRANTDDAVARGAFGAPTVFVNNQMFIGNDRLAFVERAARGEQVHPAASAARALKF